MYNTTSPRADQINMPSNAIKTFSAGLVNRRYLGLEKAARMARWLDMVA